MARSFRCWGFAWALFVGALLSHPASASPLPEAVYEAIEGGDLPRLQQLLPRAQINERHPETEVTPLISAVIDNQLAVVTWLLDQGADVNLAALPGGLERRTPLMLALGQEQTQMARLLIERGASLKAVDAFPGNTPLMHAIKAEQWELMPLMIPGSDLNIRNRLGNTPLFLAVAQGNLEVVQQLIRQGAHWQTRNDTQETLLMWAAADGHLELAQWLQQRGLGINDRDKAGDTALGKAAWRDRTELVAWLLTQGANPSLADQEGYTPLMGAAEQGHQEVVTLLLAAKSPLESRTIKGDTPILRAALKERWAVVELLIAHGADPCAQNSAGQSAYDLVIASNLPNGITAKCK
jgi:ankyrin repeat protein